MDDQTSAAITEREHTTSVILSDAELVLLDGQVNEEAQRKVDAAKARLVAAINLDHLSSMAAGFVADVVQEARDNGLLSLTRKPLRRCSLCGTDAGYAKFKSGPRRGQPNYGRPLRIDGFDLARRFVSVDGHARVGGCAACVAPLLGDIAEALRGVPAEVPEALRAEGEPRRKKHGNRHCKKCDWSGHEGEMRWERTMMGDGKYPAYCPSCGAGGAFNRDVEMADGFVVVPLDSGSEVRQ